MREMAVPGAVLAAQRGAFDRTSDRLVDPARFHLPDRSWRPHWGFRRNRSAQALEVLEETPSHRSRVHGRDVRRSRPVRHRRNDSLRLGRSPRRFCMRHRLRLGQFLPRSDRRLELFVRHRPARQLGHLYLRRSDNAVLGVEQRGADADALATRHSRHPHPPLPPYPCDFRDAQAHPGHQDEARSALCRSL